MTEKLDLAELERLCAELRERPVRNHVIVGLSRALPPALSRLRALERVAAAAKEYIDAAKTWAGSADDDPGDVAETTKALDRALKEAGL